MGALVPQIVGANHGGVPPGIAAAQPSLLDHRDIGNAMLLGEVIGRRQAMPAAADDDDVIGRPRLGAAPGLGPVFVVAARVARQAEDGITRLHPALPKNAAKERPPGSAREWQHARERSSTTPPPATCRRRATPAASARGLCYTRPCLGLRARRRRLSILRHNFL